MALSKIEPSPEAYYQQSSRYHATQLEVDETSFAWIARERARKLQPLIADTNRVLEFGAGTGLNLAAIRCAARFAFDIGKHLGPELERRGIRFIESTTSIETGSFEIVLCHHALEHVPDPAAALSEMRRLLCPNGRLILFVPYEREARYRRYRADEPNHHLYSWSPQTLGNLVTSSGFRVDACGLETCGYERFAAQVAGTQLLFHALLRFLQTIRPAAEVRLVATKEQPR